MAGVDLPTRPRPQWFTVNRAVVVGEHITLVGADIER